MSNTGEIASSKTLNEKIGGVSKKTNYAYLMEWHEYYTPNILNEIFGYNIINKKKTLSSASINSKSINKNSIFFGIKGKKFDGNKFAIEAINNGAILAISNFRVKNSKLKFIRNPLNLLNTASSILRKSLNTNTIAICSFY